jgi:hypothetical protein
MDRKTLFPLLEAGFSNSVFKNIPALNSINNLLLNRRGVELCPAISDVHT